MISLCSALFETVIPSKIFKFMAMNVPVIMGVKGEALDIVLKANTGVAMRPDSKASLLECIRLIREKEKGAFMGRAYAAQHFPTPYFDSEISAF